MISASNSAPFKPVKQRKKNPMLDKNGIAKRIAPEVMDGTSTWASESPRW